MPQAPETAPQPSELPMRLTRLRVKNFRSIAELDIPLSPLTVLVGPNGSGKSNVVDALRFVRDVFARGLDQAVMDREGMGVIQRWGTEEITIGVDLFIEAQSEEVFSEGNALFSTPKRLASTTTYEFAFREAEDKSFVITRELLKVKIIEGSLPEVLVFRRKSSFIKVKFGKNEWLTTWAKGALPWKMELDEQLLLPAELFGHSFDGFLSVEELKTSKEKYDFRLNIEQTVEDAIHCLNHNVFYTLNPSDLRRPQQVLKETPLDEKGRNLAAVLRRLYRLDDSEWNNLRDALRQAVIGFENIQIEPVGGYLATKLLYHTDDPAKPRASYLGQESDGTIRMLGLLAALYQEPAQPFISIEEPEANIHPGALAVLAGVLDEASLRSQVLVTTHSPDMLDHLPAESFLVVEKVGDATRVGPLDAGQLESVRKRLFTPGELLRMEGLQRQADNDSAG